MCDKRYIRQLRDDDRCECSHDDHSPPGPLRPQPDRHAGMEWEESCPLNDSRVDFQEHYLPTHHYHDHQQSQNRNHEQSSPHHNKLNTNQYRQRGRLMHRFPLVTALSALLPLSFLPYAPVYAQGGISVGGGLVLDECYTDLFNADSDDDFKLSQMEFVSFVRLQSGEEIGGAPDSGFQFWMLPQQLIGIYNFFACGDPNFGCPSAGLDITGIDGNDDEEGGAASKQQTTFLYQLCKTSSDTIFTILNPVITVAPSPPTTPLPTPLATPSPTSGPTIGPSASPLEPTVAPTFVPTSMPTAEPSNGPSAGPTIQPSVAFSTSPSVDPSSSPSVDPSSSPSVDPSSVPSAAPSVAASALPSVGPSIAPSAGSSTLPSILTGSPLPPTPNPTNSPSTSPPAPTPPPVEPCPTAYIDDYAYEAGELVVNPNASGGTDEVRVIYRCKSFPYSPWCSQAPYEPGVGSAWEQAWDVVGVCVETTTTTTTTAATTATQATGVAPIAASTPPSPLTVFPTFSPTTTPTYNPSTDWPTNSPVDSPATTDPMNPLYTGSLPIQFSYEIGNTQGFDASSILSPSNSEILDELTLATVTLVEKVLFDTFGGLGDSSAAASEKRAGSDREFVNGVAHHTGEDGIANRFRGGTRRELGLPTEKVFVGHSDYGATGLRGGMKMKKGQTERSNLRLLQVVYKPGSVSIDDIEDIDCIHPTLTDGGLCQKVHCSISLLLVNEHKLDTELRFKTSLERAIDNGVMLLPEEVDYVAAVRSSVTVIGGEWSGRDGGTQGGRSSIDTNDGQNSDSDDQWEMPVIIASCAVGVVLLISLSAIPIVKRRKARQEQEEDGFLRPSLENQIFNNNAGLANMEIYPPQSIPQKTQEHDYPLQDVEQGAIRQGEANHRSNEPEDAHLDLRLKQQRQNSQQALRQDSIRTSGSTDAAVASQRRTASSPSVISGRSGNSRRSDSSESDSDDDSSEYESYSDDDDSSGSSTGSESDSSTDSETDSSSGSSGVSSSEDIDHGEGHFQEGYDENGNPLYQRQSVPADWNKYIQSPRNREQGQHDNWSVVQAVPTQFGNSGNASHSTHNNFQQYPIYADKLEPYRLSTVVEGIEEDLSRSGFSLLDEMTEVTNSSEGSSMNISSRSGSMNVVDKGMYRSAILTLLREADPDNVDRIDDMMEEYEGREEVLIGHLSTMLADRHRDSDIDEDEDDKNSNDGNDGNDADEEDNDDGSAFSEEPTEDESSHGGHSISYGDYETDASGNESTNSKSLSSHELSGYMSGMLSESTSGNLSGNMSGNMNISSGILTGPTEEDGRLPNIQNLVNTADEGAPRAILSATVVDSSADEKIDDGNVGANYDMIDDDFGNVGDLNAHDALTEAAIAGALALAAGSLVRYSDKSETKSDDYSVGTNHDDDVRHYSSTDSDVREVRYIFSQKSRYDGSDLNNVSSGDVSSHVSSPPVSSANATAGTSSAGDLSENSAVVRFSGLSGASGLSEPSKGTDESANESVQSEDGYNKVVDNEAYRATIEALVKEAIPGAVYSIDDMMDEYEGREELLIGNLSAMIVQKNSHYDHYESDGISIDTRSQTDSCLDSHGTDGGLSAARGVRSSSMMVDFSDNGDFPQDYDMYDDMLRPSLNSDSYRESRFTGSSVADSDNSMILDESGYRLDAMRASNRASTDSGISVTLSYALEAPEPIISKDRMSLGASAARPGSTRLITNKVEVTDIADNASRNSSVGPNIYDDESVDSATLAAGALAAVRAAAKAAAKESKTECVATIVSSSASEEELSVVAKGSESTHCDDSSVNQDVHDTTRAELSTEKNDSFRTTVEVLLKQVMPSEVNNMDDILREYEGREDELINTLSTMLAVTRDHSECCESDAEDMSDQRYSQRSEALDETHASTSPVASYASENASELEKKRLIASVVVRETARGRPVPIINPDDANDEASRDTTSYDDISQNDCEFSSALRSTDANLIGPGQKAEVDNKMDRETDDCQSDESTATKQESYRTAVAVLLKQVMPHEVNDLDGILSEYEGRENELVGKLSTMLASRDSESDNPSDDNQDYVFPNDVDNMDIEERATAREKMADMKKPSVGAAKSDLSQEDTTNHSEETRHDRISLCLSDTTEVSLGTAQTKAAYRSAVLELLKIALPDEVDNVDDMLKKYDGREDELVSILAATIEGGDGLTDIKKESRGSSFSSKSEVLSQSNDSYGATNTKEHYRSTVVSLVQLAVPEELDNVNSIIQRYDGREEELIDYLSSMLADKHSQREHEAKDTFSDNHIQCAVSQPALCENSTDSESSSAGKGVYEARISSFRDALDHSVGSSNTSKESLYHRDSLSEILNDQVESTVVSDGPTPMAVDSSAIVSLNTSCQSEEFHVFEGESSEDETLQSSVFKKNVADSAGASRHSDDSSGFNSNSKGPFTSIGDIIVND